jgi:hypothetical protein
MREAVFNSRRTGFDFAFQKKKKPDRRLDPALRFRGVWRIAGPARPPVSQGHVRNRIAPVARTAAAADGAALRAFSYGMFCCDVTQQGGKTFLVPG